MNKRADDINNQAELMIITVNVCLMCSLLRSSARTAPGEITVLLADAVIGSQGEDALHSLVSTALIARLDSLLLKLLLPRKLFLCPW